jgi:hypothetical protein
MMTRMKIVAADEYNDTIHYLMEHMKKQVVSTTTHTSKIITQVLT